MDSDCISHSIRYCVGLARQIVRHYSKTVRRNGMYNFNIRAKLYLSKLCNML